LFAFVHTQGFFCYDTIEHVPYDKKHSDYSKVCLVYTSGYEHPSSPYSSELG